MPDLLPIALIVAAVAAFVAVSVYRLRSRARSRSPRAPIGPIVVPPDEVELREGPIHACMHCGATSVRPAAFSEGGIPGAGAMLFYICARCGHRGPPLEFEDATAWREFVKGLNEPRDRVAE